jgi:DNA repair protein RadC
MIPEIKIKVEIGTREEEIKITSSNDAAKVFKKLFDADLIQWREEVIMLCLNRNNVVIGYYKLASGGTTSCVVDAKMIYTIALNSTASSIILAHNHPSGSLKPSEPDKALTNKLIEAGKLLDIALLDHLIITNDSHFSMADEGVI